MSIAIFFLVALAFGRACYHLLTWDEATFRAIVLSNETAFRDAIRKAQA